MSANASPIETRRPPVQPLPEDAARADMYALLAALFYGSPSADLLDAIVAAPALAGQGDAALPPAWEELKRAAASADPEALREEYDNTFISIGEAPVLLYGSHYLTGYLHEKPLADLRRMLARLGLGRKEEVREPEDHISAVCDVMRHLILGGEAGFEVQRDFFTRFIQPWYAKLADRLEIAPQLTFYRDVGRFTRAFFDVETASFDMESA